MIHFLIICLLAFSATAACAARPAVEQPEGNPAEQIMEEPAPAGFAYGKKGLQFTSADGNNVSVKAISASVNGRLAPQLSHWSPATACIRVSPAMAADWFFNGHRNKLTSDISYINRRMAPETDTNVRFRIQWDVSFQTMGAAMNDRV